MPVRPWMAREVKQVRAMYLAGHSVRSLAERMGRSEGAIRYKLVGVYRQGHEAAHKEWSPEELSKAVGMAEQGMTRCQIGQALGRTEGAVTRKLGRAGVKAYRLWNGDDTRKAVEMREAGANYSAIARELGFHPSSVQSHLEAAGVEGCEPRKKPRPWTQDETLRLLRGAGEGLSMAAIAAELGRTDVAVYVRWRGITNGDPKLRPWSAADVAMAKSMRGEGMTWAQVGQALCRTGGACRAAVERAS